MNNPKGCKRDRLSELPDSLIFELFWLLPMTDVVRTSVLSKRWRSLWITTPFLNFDNRIMKFDDNRLGKFINRALLRWNGNKVLKFRFHSRHKLFNSMFSDIDLWVSFAKRNGVEELHLHVLCNPKTVRMVVSDVKGEIYCVPQCLYSCSSLKELTLQCCNLEIYGNVLWNQLKSLRIEEVSATADVINQILSVTPQLRVFNLRYFDRGGNLSIQSSSLKELSIHKYLLGRQDLSVVSELRICTPNLETLEIISRLIPYSKCVLTNVSSLTRATLGLVGLDHCPWRGLLIHGVELSSGNTLSQILPTIRHVENVTLSFCCTKVLRAMKMKCVHSSFPNVKSLELTCCFYDYKQVVAVLEMFPQLERLVLSDNKRDDRQDHDGESLKFDVNIPESFLLQLRTVEVIWTKGNGIFPLIEIVLKYACMLEKMVFRLIEIKSPAPSPSSDRLLLVSQKLLRMRRSSPNATIDVTKIHLRS